MGGVGVPRGLIDHKHRLFHHTAMSFKAREGDAKRLGVLKEKCAMQTRNSVGKDEQRCVCV